MIMILSEQVATLRAGEQDYPDALLTGLGIKARTEFWAAGPLHLLSHPKTGFFCSSQCPGSIVLKTFDIITRMRDEGKTLIGGFHSVMEWECLRILLRGRQPVIWVPARSIVGMHLKPELVPAFNAGRLLILSPFPPKSKRITAALAEARNRLVGALADHVFVPHAAPGSKTAALCDSLLTAGKPLYTVNDPANEHLISMGAIPLTPNHFSTLEAGKPAAEENTER
jgi:predicted Rossmann fold nucleotide-binding protein DprA/Smf involved in DNA uptake